MVRNLFLPTLHRNVTLASPENRLKVPYLKGALRGAEQQNGW